MDPEFRFYFFLCFSAVKKQEKVVYPCIIIYITTSLSEQNHNRNPGPILFIFVSLFVGIHHPLPQSLGTVNSNFPTKVFGVPQTGGKQIPRCLYAGDNSWRLVVQLAVKVACPLFGPGDWWGLPPQHRGVLWERVKSMRSVQRRRLRVPESEPQG